MDGAALARDSAKPYTDPIVEKITDLNDELGITKAATSVSLAASKKVGEAASVISSAAENLDDRLGGHGGKIVSKLSYQIQKGVEQLQSSIGSGDDIRCLMLGFDKAGKT